MLFALAGLCLLAILAIPVTLHVALARFEAVHARTLNLIEDTQLVQGTPAALVKQKQESVREQVKEQAERRVANMPRISDNVRF